jgi:hypothetical protein
MDATRWSVIDDLAHRRCPDNLDAGYSEIVAMAACLEEWAEPKMRFREKALVALGFGLTPFALATAALWNLGDISTLVAICLIGGWLALIAIFFGLPSLGPQLLMAYGQPGLFANPSLQPLRDHLSDLHDSDRHVFDAEGNKVGKDELKNDWLLFAYVADKRLRQLAISIRNRVRSENYAGGLFVLRPQPQAIEPESEDTKDEAAASVSSTPKALAKPIKRLWISYITKRNFDKRKPLVLRFWSYPQRTQVDEMLTIAHQTALANRTISKPALKRICIEHLIAKALPIGLGDGRAGKNENSDEWIDRMLGDEKKHRYRLVRLILTDPESAESKEFLSELPLNP